MQQYDVTELTTLLKSLIDQTFPELIMVHGEVSSFSRASSGHMYFILKDDFARLKAAYFRQHMRRDAFIPKNGDKVSVIGELRVYEGDGTYQLIVRKVVYNAEGDFWRKFEEIKTKLDAMGLFEAETKRPLPLYPKRVALLTAVTGAAVKDFIVTAGKDGYFFRIDVWPVPVQGKEAAGSIVAALKKAGKRRDLYDVLVLSRGGGSLDDLAVFNEEAVALALKASDVPTISAIGHEQDISICDMVADVRVATPTAAAERLTAAYKEAAVKNERYYTRLLRVLRLRMENATLDIDRLGARLYASGAVSKLEREKIRLSAMCAAMDAALNRSSTEYLHKLEKLEQRLENNSPRRKFNELNQRLATFGMHIIHALKNTAVEREKELSGLYNRLFAQMPAGLMNDYANKIKRLEASAVSNTEKILLKERHRLDILSQRLEMSDPEKLLSMGYALVMKNGSVVTELEDIHLDDELDIKMKAGQLSAFVTGKKI